MANNERSSPSPSIDPPPVKILYKGLYIPLSWKEAADTIAYDSCTCPPPVVFVCGARNSSKSIFGRVLLDTLFKRYRRVGYLEIDVGQPEFTPPGCVSLHILEDETPDLTVLCLKTPEKCLFFGDLCPNANTENYLLYARNTYNYFIKKFYKLDEADEAHKYFVPLIINTSGCINGSGLNVLVDLVGHMTPTHVVRVQHTKEIKNLPDGAFSLISGEKSSAEIIDICSVDKTTSITSRRNEIQQMRELRFIAYFRQCLPRDLDIPRFSEYISQLSSLPPFEISLSKINVTHLHCQDSTGMTYDSLIGMIVGLAISSSESSSTSVPLPWCVGLGLVRSIDIDRGKIYLIAPIPLRIIEKVDILLQGSIKVPSSLELVTLKVESKH